MLKLLFLCIDSEVNLHFLKQNLPKHGKIMMKIMYKTKFLESSRVKKKHQVFLIISSVNTSEDLQY